MTSTNRTEQEPDLPLPEILEHEAGTTFRDLCRLHGDEQALRIWNAVAENEITNRPRDWRNPQ